MFAFDPYFMALVGAAGTLQHSTPLDMDGVVTDSTDLTCNSTSGHDIGASFSLTIPTVGLVGLYFEQVHVESATASPDGDIGLQVNGVDHWLIYSNRPAGGARSGMFSFGASAGRWERIQDQVFRQIVQGHTAAPMVYWDVQQFGLATGSQTCKVRVRKTDAGVGNLVFKGASKVQTRLKYFTIDYT